MGYTSTLVNTDYLVQGNPSLLTCNIRRTDCRYETERTVCQPTNCQTNPRLVKCCSCYICTEAYTKSLFPFPILVSELLQQTSVDAETSRAKA